MPKKPTRAQVKSKNKEGLDYKQIATNTKKRLRKYSNLNFLEKYAMYMGTAQILELGLKNILIKKFNYEATRIEKWTLGYVADELQRNNLRQDFIYLLKNVKSDRNNIAHELLANSIIVNALIPEKDRALYSKPYRMLDKAIFEIEQLYFLFEWTEKTNNWD